MHKVSIIAPVRTSPPVVTEFLQYVEEDMSERVTDLTLIATREPLVLSVVELIEAAVRRRYPHVHAHVVELPFADVTSDREHLEFMKVCARVIRDQHEVHGADKVYLCVAGGRKDMCITMALLGQYLGVNGVFHVVMPDVKAFNVELERARATIEELAKAEDKDAYYRERAELFDPTDVPAPKLLQRDNDTGAARAAGLGQGGRQDTEGQEAAPRRGEGPAELPEGDGDGELGEGHQKIYT
jgi:CRISPR-associated protein Csx14